MTARKGHRICSQCGKQRADRFFRGARGTLCDVCVKTNHRKLTRSGHLMTKYGITLEDYELMYAAQDGRCAICRRKPTYSLDVDHDHKLEKALIAEGVVPIVAVRRSIRGLLCKLCNRRLLSSVRDSVEALLSAVEYLRTPPAFPLLGAEPHSHNAT